MNVRINADDFGVSPGVNQAIQDMFREKKLHSASLVCGCGYLEEAIKIAKENPKLKLGLHFNITTGTAVFKHTQPSILVDSEGRFKNGFLKLLLLSIFKRKLLLEEVKKELEAQIALIKKADLRISHIDSHRHVHVIPAIFVLVKDLAKKNQIKHVRVINERLGITWSIKHAKTFLVDGGIIKWGILRFLGVFNDDKLFSETYFFSILYTCSISNDLIKKIKAPSGFKHLEVMIHPGNPDIDADLVLEEKRHLLSKDRYTENSCVTRSGV